VFIHSGNLATEGIDSSDWSHVALLAVKIWAVGRRGTWVSRLPAGTTTKAPFICTLGSADPHREQKDRLWRVDGRVNWVILSCPQIHLTTAVPENRFEACAEPESLRQYSQWHR
jgi:hypothetical protein